METLTHQQISGRLTAALATIISLYDEMLEPVSRSGQGGGSSELNRTERIIAVREEIGYQTWATIEAICDEHGLDTPKCNEYDVIRHITWLRAHTNEFATYTGANAALEEMEDCAEAITNIVFGHKRPPFTLGACTTTNCAGNVKDAGQNDDGVQIARCTTCKTTGTVTWWAEQMRMPVRSTLDSGQLIALAHQQYGRRITPAAIRQAVSRHYLTPIKDTRPQQFKITDCIGYLTRTS